MKKSLLQIIRENLKESLHTKILAIGAFSAISLAGCRFLPDLPYQNQNDNQPQQEQVIEHPEEQTPENIILNQATANGLPVTKGKTNSQGHVQFMDGVEPVDIYVKGTNGQLLPDTEVIYVNGNHFEAFIAAHPSHAQALYIYAHNSSHTLSLTQAHLQAISYNGNDNENNHDAALDFHDWLSDYAGPYLGCISTDNMHAIMDTNIKLIKVGETIVSGGVNLAVTAGISEMGDFIQDQLGSYDVGHLFGNAPGGALVGTVTPVDIRPLADETCDNVDNDCDGLVDEVNCSSTGTGGYCSDCTTNSDCRPGFGCSGWNNTNITWCTPLDTESCGDNYIYNQEASVCTPNYSYVCGENDENIWIRDSCGNWAYPTEGCLDDQTCQINSNNEPYCATGCVDECYLEETFCSDNTHWQECADSDGDGCLELNNPQQCNVTQTCLDGICTTPASCTDDCNPGERTCVDTNNYVTCGQYDEDTCLDWNTFTLSCLSDEVCENGQCVTPPESCIERCSPGEKRCLDETYFQECGNFNTDNCLEFSPPYTCPANTVCEEDSCNPVQSDCTNECNFANDIVCTSSTSYRRCGYWDEDPCLDLSTSQALCGDNEVCQNNQCIETECSDDCNYDGQKGCIDNKSWTCGQYDGDPCLDMSTPIYCGTNTCIDGICQSCTDEILDGEDNDCNGEIDNGYVGTGSPQFSLMWDSTADLDLHVQSPDGCNLFYNNRDCGTGHLDRDARMMCNSELPPENIYWEYGTAAPGIYEIIIHYFSDCDSVGSVDFTLNVSNNGQISSVSDTISAEGDIRNYIIEVQ